MAVDYPDSWSQHRVILAHDWLTGMRGGEKVLELLCDGFPDAPIYTLFHFADAVSEAINRHPVHHSWLQHLPAARKRYRYYLPLFPGAIRQFNPGDHNLVISTSHCVAKGIRKPSGAKHLCYCFTPMRYAWTFYEEYFGRNPVTRMILGPLLARFRRWDKKTAGNIDLFVAISNHIKDRIHNFYGRDAEVVYPPVDLDFYTPGEPATGPFDLIVSALVPYKRIGLAVEAYNRSGRELRIVGIGTEMEALKKRARPNIRFLGWATNEEIRDLYRQCHCLVFPGEEDFGIVPVEAQACGRPVVGFSKGGLLETVVDGRTGLFFNQPSPDSLSTAVEHSLAIPWNPEEIRENAERFSTRAFISGLERCIQTLLKS